MTSKAQPTILVFDSGIGGLSVYAEIYKLFPQRHYLYAFDNAGFPYGDKADAVIVQRVVKMIEAVSENYPIDLAVIACNTASTISLPVLRAKFAFPIVGVVPAIKPATQITQNGHIGLLATKATTQRQYTQDLIAQFASHCQVSMLGLPELAVMAEAKLHGETVDMEQLRQLMQPWLKCAMPPDTIVLGCTHYPFLRPELQSIFPNANLIDSGEAVAKRVALLLQQQETDIQSADKTAENVALYSDQSALDSGLTKHLKKFNFNKYQQVRLKID